MTKLAAMNVNQKEELKSCKLTIKSLKEELKKHNENGENKENQSDEPSAQDYAKFTKMMQQYSRQQPFSNNGPVQIVQQPYNPIPQQQSYTSMQQSVPPMQQMSQPPISNIGQVQTVQQPYYPFQQHQSYTPMQQSFPPTQQSVLPTQQTIQPLQQSNPTVQQSNQSYYPSSLTYGGGDVSSAFSNDESNKRQRSGPW